MGPQPSSGLRGGFLPAAGDAQTVLEADEGREWSVEGHCHRNGSPREEENMHKEDI